MTSAGAHAGSGMPHATRSALPLRRRFLPRLRPARLTAAAGFFVPHGHEALTFRPLKVQHLGGVDPMVACSVEVGYTPTQNKLTLVCAAR